jgi:hypothetical protein
LAQPLVFSNSKQSAISQSASGNTFSHHSMVSRKQTFPLTLAHIHSHSFVEGQNYKNLISGSGLGLIFNPRIRQHFIQQHRISILLD